MATVDSELRVQSSYGLAHRAIDALDAYRVWPTPLNYELSLHIQADPDGPLSKAVSQLLTKGALHSEDFGEKLAREFLPRVKAEAEIFDAGEALTLQLDHVGRVIGGAQDMQGDVLDALSVANAGLSTASTAPEARAHLLLARAAIEAADQRAQSLKQELSASAAEVERLRAKLERGRLDALTDGLTGLGNRRIFDQEIVSACEESERGGDPLTLAMIDIDHFKSFNDTWGHQTGDQVIRFIASAIAAFSAPPLVAARYGGEEFAVIMPREELDTASVRLNELRTAVSGRELRRRTTGEALGKVTISIGVAQRERGEPASHLIERADAALYMSKRGGRNLVSCARQSPDLRLVTAAA